MSSDVTTPKPSRPWGRASRVGLIAAVLVIGAVGGFGAGRSVGRVYPQRVLLLQPAPIAQTGKAGPVAFKGQVAETFGSKFILQDDSGRALVDTGPQGDHVQPLPQGETVTVQGYFDRDVLHANVLTRADGSTEAFNPPGPPRGPGRRPPEVPVAQSMSPGPAGPASAP